MIRDLDAKLSDAEFRAPSDAISPMVSVDWFIAECLNGATRSSNGHHLPTLGHGADFCLFLGVRCGVPSVKSLCMRVFFSSVVV